MKYLVSFIVIVAILTALYFGYITMIGKVMHSEKTQEDPMQNFRVERDQSEKVQDLRERQKRLMEDRRQKLRDMQRL